MVARGRGRGGYTLIEVLVTVSVIAVLLAILLPTLGSARRMAWRSICQANQRSWGQGLRAYASDNNRQFPDNLDGQHCSWVGAAVRDFFRDYLKEFRGTPDERADRKNPVFCPTQEWHRDVAVARPQDLVGYFYLPFRRPSGIYAPAGMGWIAKTQFDGPFADSPILMDMKQANGPVWHYGNGSPFSSHVTTSAGEPDGGYFLFEDGHVAWYLNDEVGLGADLGGWKCYYKVPIQ